MNIEKLSSGKYRIRQMYKGKVYRVTVDHKPTRKEALELLSEEFDTPQIKGSFREYAIKYIESKESILSPRTVKEYYRQLERLPSWFTELNLREITQETIQNVVNEMARTLSPKTVKDRYSFISSVMALFCPTRRVNVTLPQMAKENVYIPSSDDVRVLLAYIKENEPTYYIPVVLACYSLRRSEICALTIEDIDQDKSIVHINKALVQDKDNKWVVKRTKTTMSERDIPIPQEITDAIIDQGYIYKGFPEQIAKCITRSQKKLGMEHFSLHKLRHYFASRLLELGVDQKTAQELGGWKGNETISKIYQHSLAIKDEERKKEISQKLADTIL